MIGTLVEAPTSRLIGTCFMEDLAYMYRIRHFVVLVHGGVHVLLHSHMVYALMILCCWYFLISTKNWYLFDTWLWYLVHDGDIS